MNSGIEYGLQTALDYAADNSHGYVLQGRTYSVGTDCAGFVRLYAAAVEGVTLEQYPDFHTWTERATLTSRGWGAIPFRYANARRGDVLLRERSDGTGHTVVFLGDGRIVGAEGDWDKKQGDSSGTEVTERSYYDYSYNWILRPSEVCDMTDEQAQQLQAIYTEVTRRDDPSGRGVEMTTHEHVKFIAGQVAETRNEVLRTDDCTGRDAGQLDHDKLNFMAAKQETMYQALKLLCEKVGVSFGPEDTDES